MGEDSVYITGRLFQLKGETASTERWGRNMLTADAGGVGGGWLSALNQAPGVQLEERSPGSLRLSIRGSALRSPFGVRNVKMYYNGLPLTDAGGNTYFNMINPAALGSVELAKGPAASQYGAGTGGVLWLQSPSQTAQIDMIAEGGSFTQGRLGLGLFRPEKQHLSSFLHLNTHYGEGYRDQTKSYGWQSAFVLNVAGPRKKQFTILTNQIKYGTPGGLTRAQMEANPRAARPAAGPLPSAEDAHASILQQNILVGYSRNSKAEARWQNTSSLFATLSSVINPSIRNYETRLEPNAGFRSVFNRDFSRGVIASNWDFGTEWQMGGSDLRVYDNENGKKAAIQTRDAILQWYGFVFLQHELTLREKLSLVQGISLNHQAQLMDRREGSGEGQHRKSYPLEIMPRFHLEYRWATFFQTQLIASRGFSPPTLAEVIPSTTIINTGLEAEKGWNLEMANRLRLAEGRLQWQFSLYRFSMKNAIVLQRDPSGADYFINAGSVKQHGLENRLAWQQPLNRQLPWSIGYFSVSHQYQPYKYIEYNKSGTNYSGNDLPGVPRHAAAIVADIHLFSGWKFRPAYYYQSALYLNDANTDRAEEMHRLTARIERTISRPSGRQWILFFGGDNLLNKQYSFGYDINAFGARYYNPAPAMRFFGGVRLIER